MKANEAKFEEMLLYVAERLADDPKAGATKLNKVLYYAEFGHVRATGQPITGVEYQRLPDGPAPRGLLPARRNLIRQQRAHMEETTYVGYRQHRLIPDDEADRAMFTPAEIKSIDEAIDLLTSLNAAESSELSHEEVGWLMVEERETIPYEAAYLRPPVVTDGIRRQAEKLAANLGRS